MRKALNIAVEPRRNRGEGAARRGRSLVWPASTRSTGPTIQTQAPYQLRPGRCSGAAGCRRLPASQVVVTGLGREPASVSPVWSRRTSPSGNASRSKFRGTCSTSASTCSSSRCRFREFGPLLGRGAVRCGDRRHDQRSDAVARVYVVALGAYVSRVTSTSFGYENSDAERLFESLPRSTNEAATRSADVKASAGLS